MGYFQNIKDLNELRNAYKKLLIKFHPDNNPQMDTTNIMQEINAEYDALLQRFKSSSEYTSSAEADFNEDELKHILNELVKLNADIVIEIIGTWIWVKGNTYPVKSQLKALNFKWSSQKHMWYWGTLTHRVHNAMPMEYIRMKYGSTIYQYSKEERETIDAYN